MPTGGHPSPLALDAVAASLLRSWAGTLTARLARDLPRDALFLDRLLELLGILPDARAGRIAQARDEAAAAIGAARAHGASPLPVGDPAYPEHLRHIPDPPLVLWVRGDPASLARPAVAIVGSRAASAAGLETARRLGRDLAAVGLVVVSGLARGVDGAAHRGALEAGGLTIGVLGCGVDVVYPPEHRTLMEKVGASGAIVSELRPGAPPYRSHFPLRNRIISGLSRAVVVIEASEKSGSLITAREAAEQGRDVLAVPGGIASGRYRGSHALIKDGARLVESVEDVLDEIRWPEGQRNSPRPKPHGTSTLEGSLRPGEPVSVDELADRTGRPAADLLSELSVLELAGRVARVAGGSFIRVD